MFWNILQAAVGAEIHAVSSSAKPLAGWLARDGIQECREACGGHGYLVASGFGELRNDNDANCTYEGDNNVLLQQSANWLLNLWALASRGGDVQSLSPLGSAAFLQRGQDILRSKCAVKTADQWLHLPGPFVFCFHCLERSVPGNMSRKLPLAKFKFSNIRSFAGRLRMADLPPVGIDIRQAGTPPVFRAGSFYG